MHSVLCFILGLFFWLFTFSNSDWSQEHLKKTDTGAGRDVCVYVIVCVCERVQNGKQDWRKKGSSGSGTETQKQYNGLIVPSKNLMADIQKTPIFCVSRG